MHYLKATAALTVFFPFLSAMERPQAEVPRNKLVVVTQDAQEIEIPHELIEQFKTLKNVAEDMRAESREQKLPLPMIASKALSHILQIASFAQEPMVAEALMSDSALVDLADIINALNYLDCTLLDMSIVVFVRKLMAIALIDSSIHRGYSERFEQLFPEDIKKIIKTLMHAAVVENHTNFFYGQQVWLKRVLTQRVKIDPPARVSHDDRFIIVSQDNSHSLALIDLQNGEKPVKFFKSKFYRFSPDGTYLFYVEALDFLDDFPRCRGEHTLHTGILMNIKTGVELKIMCPCTLQNFLGKNEFSSDSKSIIIGNKVYDVAMGTEIDDVTLVQISLNRETRTTTYEFSGGQVHEVNLKYPFCIRHDCVALAGDGLGNGLDIFKLLPDGSMKRIPLPAAPDASWRTYEFFGSKGGSLLFRPRKKKADDHSHANEIIDVISIADIDNPKLVGAISDSRRSRGILGDAEDGTVCLLGIEHVFVASMQEVRSIARSPMGLVRIWVDGCSFNSSCDKLIICYRDGTAYLYVNIKGPQPIRSIQIPKPGHKECIAHAYFAGFNDVFITIEQDSRAIKMWDLGSGDVFQSCSLSQLFLLIKCLQDLDMRKKPHYEALYDSLSRSAQTMLQDSDTLRKACSGEKK